MKKDICMLYNLKGCEILYVVAKIVIFYFCFVAQVFGVLQQKLKLQINHIVLILFGFFKIKEGVHFIKFNFFLM